LPFSQSGGQLLFHLISKLYENPTPPAPCCRRLLADGLSVIEVSIALVAAGEDLGL
jgi:hypothetical protein